VINIYYFYDERLINKLHRVLNSIEGDQHIDSALRYCRLVRRQLKLTTSIDFCDSFITDTQLLRLKLRK